MPTDAWRLLVDGEAFARFAAPLRVDLEADLRATRDPAIIKAREFDLAVLDGIAGHWPAAVARLDHIVAVVDDPQTKVMIGLTIRVWADAGGDAAKLPAALAARLAALPLGLVREPLETLQALAQAFTIPFCQDLVRQAIGPDAADGFVSLESASALLFQRYAVLHIVPVGPTFVELVGARLSQAE